MECYCYLRNVQDLLADGKTRYERRFGDFFKDQLFHLVRWWNISQTPRERQSEQSSIRKGSITRNSFIGYALIARGIWKGDILITEIEELEQLDASEMSPRRLNAKEVLITQRDGKFIFHVADGLAK